jgi:hypothetical protein
LQNEGRRNASERRKLASRGHAKVPREALLRFGLPDGNGQAIGYRIGTSGCIARDSLGAVAVYDETTFEREFVSSEPPTESSGEVPEPDGGFMTSRQANPCYWSPEQLRLYCLELALNRTSLSEASGAANELYRFIIDGPKGVDATAVAA